MTKPLLALVLLAAAGCGSPAPSASGPIEVFVQLPDAPADTDASLAASPDPALEVPVEVLGGADLESPEAGPPTVRYTLRRGETLAHFARWSGQPVEEVATSSALELDGLYAVGTEIALHLTPEEAARVEQRRDAHHQTRASSYLASRGATGTAFYRVRTGDSAWTVAQDHQGVPVWLLESLNPSVDLERLRPGQELLVPAFPADPVVEVPPAAADPAVGG